MKAIGYVRVSTEEQAREGISLEAQQQMIETYARLKGLELTRVYVDAGVTTKIPLERRTGGAEFLSALESGVAVVAFKLDRMFRNTVECLSWIEDWDKRGIAVHFLDLGGQAVDTQSAMGRFFLTIMAAVAELERNQIGERTAAVKAHQRRNGGFCGGFVPWGFKLIADRLVVNEEEQAAIATARRYRKRGWSLRKIGNELSDRGFRPRRGKAFGAEQVKHLLAAADRLAA